MKCPIGCDYEFESLKSLRVHWQKRHKRSSKELYVSLFLDGVEPTCACGCKEKTKYWGLMNGFAKFVQGHAARVNNNWGHNNVAKKKSQNTRRKMWENGEILPWFKGKAKDDPVIIKMREKGRQTILNDPERRRKRSELMRQNRLNGTIPTLTGSAHSQWKGGTSALQPLVRAHVNPVWTYPKLKKSGFKCSCCESSGPGLEVHHDGERFADILQKAIQILGEPGEDFDKKIQVADWVADYHVKNDVSGVVLCSSCHDYFHSLEKKV